MQPNTNSMLVCVCVCVFSACWWLGIYNDKTVCYSYSSHHTAATCIYDEQPLKRRTFGVSESIPDILSLLPLVVATSDMKLLCVCVCVCVCVCARAVTMLTAQSVSPSSMLESLEGYCQRARGPSLQPACDEQWADCTNGGIEHAMSLTTWGEAIDVPEQVTKQEFNCNKCKLNCQAVRKTS